MKDDASAIRPRRESDLAACADLVREVHAADRYPRYLPRDIGTFLAPPDPYGCWVADAGGAVVGHVALVARGLPATMEIAASALRRSPAQLAVVARLFVSARTRGHGTGLLLLKTAAAAAAALELHPVLDVDTELTAAIALYESAGWTQAGRITVRVPDDQPAGGTGAERGQVERVLTEYVYLGPKPGRGAAPGTTRR